jgi:hypothetical protein
MGFAGFEMTKITKENSTESGVQMALRSGRWRCTVCAVS